MGQVPDVSSLTNDEIPALVGGRGSGPGIPHFNDSWMTVRVGGGAAGARRRLARGINPLRKSAVILVAGDGDMGEDG